MSVTLSYGYKKPVSGDKGSALFQDLEDNIQRVNDHTHDGTNSPPLPSQNVQKGTQNILQANWASYGGPAGHFRQLVTLPAGFLFDSTVMSFRTSTGQVVNPTVERVAPTQYNIFSIDNTVDLVAVYG